MKMGRTTMGAMTVVAFGATLGLMGSTPATAQDAVQWRTQDGGNGHWYELRLRPDGLTWSSARSQAVNGSHLVAAETPSEQAFLFERFNPESIPAAYHSQGGSGGCTQIGPWIGAFQQPESPEPSGGWRWVTGIDFDPTMPQNCCNNDCAGPEGFLHLYKNCNGEMSWNDLPDDGSLCAADPRSYVVEWSADCNLDGIVDYGQILAGDLADSDFDWIPDQCDPDFCRADITGGGSVDGVDLSILLSAWGTDGQGEFDADVNSDGIVDGFDLTLMLSAWGPCPD